ncbi:hypothetical protein BDM02DRAFT_2505168 [Thelephora ganbajun]|uniref:Uncharacterized protein n=1 Tax=Thelephora ganbajun TaxID=370292 RepID=A0ACB6ZDW3_THEGA|nr:hypothetical protein BDM02DRAFT_2505168 [Thelephora ganbajun]
MTMTSGIHHQLSLLQLRLCLLGPSIFFCLEGCEISRADCWTYRTVFTFEGSFSRGVTEISDELVAACSDTLECLEILHNPFVHISPTSIDLSKATKLRDATFRALSLSVAWVTMALQTISPRHRDLRQISIHACHDLALAAVDVNTTRAFGGQWLDLDHLVQLWESRSIRTKLIHATPARETQGMGKHIGRWLAEATKRGVIDLVE